MLNSNTGIHLTVCKQMIDIKWNNYFLSVLEELLVLDNNTSNNFTVYE